MKNDRFVLNKEIIKKNFSKSAASYDQFADLQRQMMGKVFSLVNKEYPAILDLGCGTGALVGMLADKYPASRIVGIDFAPGMIEYAKSIISYPNVSFTVEDAEKLSFKGDEFDLVVSSAALQWMDYKAGIKEAARVLKPGGKFVFATFGPKTLQELRKIGLSVNDFPTQNELEEILGMYFKNISLQTKVVMHKYSTVFDLFRYLKAIGARYHSSSLDKGLLTRRRLLSLLPFANNNIEVSYEILYSVCELAVPLVS
ncbi:MAG: malonyl-ACP O-methyltransferase BioC [Candidatus Margulisiibacteriota bacterium]